ncbi:hypothetical protein SLS62_004326 [Diatrype stigma]|uniref:Uncharacterized protein n=1 Tax=Diatrype stigma TaxID=117547 RepID=A0AAN9UTG8_9PEZI
MDPLEAMGLPSKGDNRLLDFKTQERYYTKIVERYMTFCSDAGERDELLRRFASLDVNANNTNSSSRAGSSSSSSENQHLSASTTSKKPITPSLATLPSDTKALSEVLSALRKLREGIVASKRADDFAVQAYLFCIRLSVLVKHPESYHPAILHLLRRMTTTSTTTTSRQNHDDASTTGGSGNGSHGGNGGGIERSSSATTTKSTVSTTQTSIMTTVEHAEVASYLVLDTACRRGDLAEAHALRRRYGLHDARVDGVLRALAHDDWAAFARLRSRADGHRARLLEWAEPALRRHLLKCFARAYLRVDRGFLERSAGVSWAALTKDEGVGWELEGEDGGTVVIRKVKGR